MSGDDSLQVRQENEIQALKAIFNEDLRDLRPEKPRKLWNPLDIIVTLSPLRGSSGAQEVHTQVDLHIKCTKNYPNESPIIKLEKNRGISDVLVAQLQKELEQKSVQLKGEVMVYELAQHVRSFLHEHNKPVFKSFYEEMLSRQRQQEQQLLQARQLEEDRERQVMQNEIYRRQEILRSEVKLRREHCLSTSDEGPADPETKKNGRKSNSSASECGDDLPCEHRRTDLLVFEGSPERRVQRGRCVAHSGRGCVLYSSIDLGSGDVLAVAEWRAHGQRDAPSTLKLVNSIEQELLFLARLKHCNLVRYLGVKHTQLGPQLTVLVLQEFVLGANCRSLFTREGLAADVDMVRFVSRGVLAALDFLHRNNVVHKDLRDAHVFIDNGGTVRLAGYSLAVKLYDLCAPGPAPTPAEYCSKKTDIFRFGLLVLSLLRGHAVPKDAPDIPTSLPTDVYDFLTKCLAQDEKDRHSAAQLLQHQFLRTPLQRASPKRACEDPVPPRPLSPSQQSGAELKLFSRTQPGGPSRIQNEFEVLQWLGRGAFGDVLKVRNKLDGGYYAIKRIELNPKNKQLNKKITREVKLLSRLNHENVVRYYNSWIETAFLEPEENGPGAQPDSGAADPPRIARQPELSFGDDVELLAPPVRDVEWSVSYESKSKRHPENSTPTSSEDESSEDEDEDEDWMMGFLPDHVGSSSSDSIEFERNSDDKSRTMSEAASSGATGSPDTRTAPRHRELQFMYIQMEFCEKSTLRTAIDDGLHADTERVWRLFREMVEGLAHIHQQGMIHRDLKPVNIFLDLNGHVKIGDFGLATTSIMSKVDSERDALSLGPADGSLTGHVGTALYVAPELSATANRTIYNQKVDLYSLGVILFEMSYAALRTGMERIQVLSGLRQRDVAFPADFQGARHARQRAVIRLLLSHDVSQRPTAQELLQSEHVPPPVLEECELRELLRHTLASPQSKVYKYLVASCFSQRRSSVEDITYDMNLPGAAGRPSRLWHVARRALERVFRRHAAHRLSTPLLTPPGPYHEPLDATVRLMTHSGSVVTIPHDLRVPFARYVVWNNLTFLKRYCIERVYREKKIFGFHPRELYECAFDVVTPAPDGLLADAEVLSVVNEVFAEFPALRGRNFGFRLNHTLLLRAVLLHCGVPAEKHSDIHSMLSAARDGRVNKFQIRTHLTSLCLSDSAMLALNNLIETEAPVSKVAHTLRAVTRRKGEVGALARQGLAELTQIVQNCEALGVRCNVVVALGLVYNIQQYSGMMCQFVCELRKKRRRGGLMDVLAAGGRYDCMLASYRALMERSGMAARAAQAAVGVSISLDKLVQALQEEQAEAQAPADLDAVLCSQGAKPMLREKCRLLRELWAAGVRCSVLEAQAPEEIQERCSELRVLHTLVLRDTEPGVVRVRSWDKDRFQERKVNLADAADLVQRLVRPRGVGAGAGEAPAAPRAVEHGAGGPASAAVSIVSPGSVRLAASVRKRLENQILSQMEPTLQRLSGKEQVAVLALSVEGSVVRTLASHLELDDDDALRKSMGCVIERHPRHKKYLVQICDEIIECKSEDRHAVVALYSIPDATFKVLL